MINISVIIPTYIENEYLAKSLKSLSQQTVIKQAEVILADYNPSGSPFTSQIVKEFYKKYKIPIKIVPVYRPGIAFARNEGILNSIANIICNFDADAAFQNINDLKSMVDPIYRGDAVLTVCNNAFDYTQVPQSRLQEMQIPQSALDALNTLQTTGAACLEPGSCMLKEAYVNAGGFNDCDRWELATMTPRLWVKYPFMIKHILGVSVVVSPRRALKLKEMNIDVLNYNRAVRSDKIINV